MSLTPEFVLRILDLICGIVFVRVFMMKKGEGSLYKKVFISICLVSFLDSWNALNIVMSSRCSTSTSQLIMLLCEHIVMWTVTISVMIIDRRFSDLRPGRNIMLLILICFPVMGVVWNIGYSYYVGPSLADVQYDRLNSYIAIITWILLIIMNYMLVISYYVIMKYQNDRMESELLAQQYETEKRHYEDIEQMQKSVRGIRHDLDNMIQTAQILMDSGDYDGVSKLINGIGERLDQSGNTMLTGNPALDSIIGVKISRASESGIGLETDIDIPPGLDLNYESMATIFGNLLDNAIEAQMDMPEANRKIRLLIKYIDDMMIISIGNSCDPGRYTENGFETTKDDIENHGFGIQNVRSSVERLGGTIQFERSRDWFNVGIILYCITSAEGRRSSGRY